MSRRDRLADRIERLRLAWSGPLDETDLPPGTSDPIVHFTDEHGWDHEAYARALLERGGPAGPVWVGLCELDEAQDYLEQLEEDERRAIAALARRIAAGMCGGRDSFDSIRAQLVTLGELDVERPQGGTGR